MGEISNFGSVARPNPNSDRNRRIVLLEHHPNDSRIKVIDGGICQTLSTRMGTGGGNVPIIIEVADEPSIQCGSRS